MKIELNIKNYHFQEGEHFPAFKASLIIDGKPAGNAWNDGYGAVTKYEPEHEYGKKLIAEAEADCKKSAMVFKGHDGHGEFWLTRTLSLHIDQLLMGAVFREEMRGPEIRSRNEMARQKGSSFDNLAYVAYSEQMKRDMQKGILIGNPKDYCIYEIGISLARILENPDADKILVPELMKIAHRFRGMEILNTNIPEGILKRAGLATIKDEKQKRSTSKPIVQSIKRKGKGI